MSQISLAWKQKVFILPLLSLSGAFAMLAGIAGHAAASTVHICSASAPTECIVANGQGNQVTIGYSGYANFTTGNDGTWNGKYVFTFTDGNGNCLRETNSNSVEIGNGNCSPSDQGAQWAAGDNSNGSATWQNRQHTSDYMETYGTSNGKPVWGNPKSTGFYTGWIFN